MADDYDFGDLNPSYIEQHYNFENPYESGIETSRRMHYESLLSDSSPDGGLLGIVVGIVKKQEQISPSDNYISNIIGESSSELVRIKVRIPEIHTFLPVPEIGSIKPEEQRKVDMYPTFTAVDDSLPEPTLGSIVWVDYINRKTFRGPIYKGVIQGAKPGLPSSVIEEIMSVFKYGDKTLPPRGAHGKPKKETTLFVIHETGGNSLVVSPTSRITSGVSLWIGRDGTVAQTIPITNQDGSSNWANPICLAAEIMNPSIIGYKNNGLITIGQNSDYEELRIKLNWVRIPPFSYTLPGEIQCRRIWEIINQANRQFGNITIPNNFFPAISEGGKFIWGRYEGGESVGRGGKNSTSWWWESNKSRQRGITSHHRWNHGDGVFIEFYCLGRSQGLSSSDAFYAAVGAALSVDKHLTTTNDTRQYLPIGKKAMGSLPLNPKVNRSDYDENGELKENLTIVQALNARPNRNSPMQTITYSSSQNMFFTEENY